MSTAAAAAATMASVLRREAVLVPAASGAGVAAFDRAAGWPRFPLFGDFPRLRPNFVPSESSTKGRLTTVLDAQIENLPGLCGARNAAMSLQLLGCQARQSLDLHDRRRTPF